jgi:hypothetical protein
MARRASGGVIELSSACPSRSFFFRTDTLNSVGKKKEEESPIEERGAPRKERLCSSAGSAASDDAICCPVDPDAVTADLDERVKLGPAPAQPGTGHAISSAHGHRPEALVRVVAELATVDQSVHLLGYLAIRHGLGDD